MLTIAIGLTVAAVALELMLLYRSSRLLERLRRHTVAGVVLSILFSWLLGTMFGAAGMIILFAATVSTVITAAIYKSGLLLGIRWVVDRLKRDSQASEK